MRQQGIASALQRCVDISEIQHFICGIQYGSKEEELSSQFYTRKPYVVAAVVELIYHYRRASRYHLSRITMLGMLAG
jgi:hypothetical protein